ncbi:ectoine synthase [uncultured Oxalicibacterium sp.]|uniref:ectoine synthase n=1 Tax=uncultured Oxalicibacterium sp. TaxID=1168540 RepID=UPI0025FD376A|nr:ectoine synthase [uncultured Oxalicibacterium sp.]
MIVRKLKDILDTPRDVKAPTWCSRRLLLADDNMGFSMHHTVIYAGTKTHIHYKNHLEGVYCVQGTGSVELVKTGEVFKIEPGTLYALDKHDEHWLRADDTDLHLICTFNPPLVGDEVHDENGVYASASEFQQQAAHKSATAKA